MSIGRIDINEKDLPKICGAVIQLEERSDEIEDEIATIEDEIAAIGSSGGGIGGSPGGRLTLQTLTPVMTTTQSAKTTIYYTPYNGSTVPIYGGASFTATSFSELSNITTASSTGSAGPAAVTTNSNYDLFVWSNGGTLTLTRGPAWTSDTGRGTGAGTTELVRVNGLALNANAITNGPAASRGTYVGTIRSNGSSQLDWIYGSVAASGGAAFHGVWNQYNRRPVTGFIADSSNSWTYATPTFKAAHDSNTMRLSFVTGMSEDPAEADYTIFMTNAGAPTYASIAIGKNSTSTPSGMSGFSYPASAGVTLIVRGHHSESLLGFNFFQALEYASGATITFFGTAGVTGLQSGMKYTLWA